MARKTFFDVECLEGRALLSGITYSLTTDQPVYRVGQAIQLTFTETNTGNQPVLVGVQPTDFTVFNSTGAIWQSNPIAAGAASTPEELQPGQSITQTATWNGTTPWSLPGLTGSTQSYAINQWGTFFVSNLNDPQGAVATFQITDPITTTLTTDQSVYQMGQPVQVSQTETNTSNQTLTFFPQQQTGTTFWHDNQQITFIAYPQSLSLDPSTWAPGKMFTWTQTWNGVPDFGPYEAANLSGTFFAAYGPESNPVEYTAEFQITAPTTWDVVSSVTTDQSTYDLGQPVNMTFTETNAGDQPIEVVVGQDTFQVTQKGSIVWSPIFGGNDGSWELLAPGQSITQAATWNGLTNGGQSAGTGTFVVTNRVDPNGSTATIQIVDPPVQVSGVTSNGLAASGSTSSIPATSLVSSTVSTNHAAYKVGESVHITLKIGDGGTTKAALQPSRSGEHITIMEGSKVVWETTRAVRASKLKSIKPSQTINLTTVWNGRPNQPGVSGLTPGTYSIEAEYSNYRGETTIMIGRRKS